MRIFTLLLLIVTLISCNETKQTPTTTPEEIAKLFVTSVFAQHDTTKASHYATGDFKTKIANSSEEEIKQLQQITDFKYSNITTTTKDSTGLSVVSMDTIMKINEQEFKAKQSIVLKLVDNQWLVYNL